MRTPHYGAGKKPSIIGRVSLRVVVQECDLQLEGALGLQSCHFLCGDGQTCLSSDQVTRIRYARLLDVDI